MNGLTGSLLLMQKLVDDERFQAVCGPAASAARRNEVMAELSPICCYLGEETMAEIYDMSRVIEGEP